MTKLNSEALVDNPDQQMNTRLVRNNVNRPCIISDHHFYKITSINDGNMRKLGRIEEHKIPFTLELEDEVEVGNETKSVLKVTNSDGSLNEDMSVVCIVERKFTYWKCEEVKDYNVFLFRSNVQQSIRKLSCEHIGIHIVAEWEDGGSDANELPLYTVADFMRSYPNADLQKVVNLYEGKGDNFVVRHWTDEHNRKVVDKVFYVLSEEGDAFSDKGDTLQAYLDDTTHYLEIDMNIKDLKSLYKDKSE